ncbi:DUF4406 domain-containing protein [Ligilactobacillus ceti]|uniref:DUF7768 domain-containing protein n=1 Tax=Ligilactobacillus ceti TaxID=395085 RepID=UPI00048A28D4|nr:DUF4406 domain-containing protein [Ligilactobacillus ceti]
MKKEFRPLVYICAPYKGDIKSNIKKARAFAAFAYKKGAIPVTTHLMFPFLDDEKDRSTILFMDIILLGKCDEVWVLGKTISEGMKRELEVSKRRRQKIRYFSDDFKEVSGFESNSNRV